MMQFARDVIDATTLIALLVVMWGLTDIAEVLLP
jgi:hypothetical protein